jgi:hypothetical protein
VPLPLCMALSKLALTLKMAWFRFVIVCPATITRPCEFGLLVVVVEASANQSVGRAIG